MSRKARIEFLRDKIIRRSQHAVNHMRDKDCDWQAIRAHTAINHRNTCNKYPEVAAYWAKCRKDNPNNFRV